MLSLISNFRFIRGYELLEILLFCTTNTNGMILCRGIIHRIIQNLTYYQSFIATFGFYQTFLDIANDISFRRDPMLKVKLVSKEARYMHHNKEPSQCTCTKHQFKDKDCPVNNQVRLLMKSISIANEEAQKRLQSNMKKLEREEIIDEICNNLLNTFQSGRTKLGINGGGVTYLCALFQSLSFFGFLDYRLVHWVSIRGDHCGAVKLFKSLLAEGTYNIDCRKKAHVKEEAQKYMVDAKVQLSKLFNNNIPLSLIDNILCENWRMMNSKKRNKDSLKNDVYFLTPFKVGKGIQSMFRYGNDKNGGVHLEMLYENMKNETEKTILCHITNGQEHHPPLSGHLEWSDSTIKFYSVLTLDESITQLYTDKS